MPKPNQSAKFLTLSEGDASEIQELLERDRDLIYEQVPVPFDPFAPEWLGHDKLPALSICSSAASVDGVKLLLFAGADPNVTSREGDTPLHFASRFAFPSYREKRCLEIVDMLCAAGANLGAENHEGRTPIQDLGCTDEIAIKLMSYGSMPTVNKAFRLDMIDEIDRFAGAAAEIAVQNTVPEDLISDIAEYCLRESQIRVAMHYNNNGDYTRTQPRLMYGDILHLPADDETGDFFCSIWREQQGHDFAVFSKIHDLLERIKRLGFPLYSVRAVKAATEMIDISLAAWLLSVTKYKPNDWIFLRGRIQVDTMYRLLKRFFPSADSSLFFTTPLDDANSYLHSQRVRFDLLS